MYRITFTHEAWNHINQVRDENFPEDTLVGWYHTHPGFGIFLSEMDSFIQENFFNQPFQIAVVIDTKSEEEGCFIWEYGRPTPASSYWAGSREVTLAGDGAGRPAVRIPPTKFENVANGSEGRRKSNPMISIYIATVVLVLLVIAGTTWSLHAKLLSQQETLESVQSHLREIETAAADNRATLAKEVSTVNQSLESVDTTIASNWNATKDRFRQLEQHLNEVNKDVAASRSMLDDRVSVLKSKMDQDKADILQQQSRMMESMDSWFTRATSWQTGWPSPDWEWQLWPFSPLLAPMPDTPPSTETE